MSAPVIIDRYIITCIRTYNIMKKQQILHKCKKKWWIFFFADGDISTGRLYWKTVGYANTHTQLLRVYNLIITYKIERKEKTVLSPAEKEPYNNSGLVIIQSSADVRMLSQNQFSYKMRDCRSVRTALDVEIAPL